MTITPSRYIAPTAWGEIAFMKTVRWLTERGISLLGSRVLTVRGARPAPRAASPSTCLTWTASAASSPPAATPNGSATSVRLARPSCG
jgi:hypothetical protein